MTEKEILSALKAPNGSEFLAKQENAFELIEPTAAMIKSGATDASSIGAVLSFLVRMSRKKAAKEKIAKLIEPELWETLLLSLEPKIRKNAARLLGALQQKDQEKILIKALTEETVDLVRPSQILALGAMKTQSAAAFLDCYTVAKTEPSAAREKHRREEEEALRKARALLIRPQGHPFLKLPKGYPVVLTVANGLEEVLTDEVEELGGVVAGKQKGALTIESKNKSSQAQNGGTKAADKEEALERILKTSRCYREWLIPLQSPLPGLSKDKTRPNEGAAWAALRKEILSILEECLQKEEEKTVYTFRIQADQSKSKKAHEKERADAIRRIAKELETPSFINAPSHYEIELRVHQKQLLLKFSAAKDERFLYRKQAIAASIHPANAAGIVRLAAPYLKENAVVSDPCCGSATLLIERALYRDKPVKKVIGSDISKIALEAAKENLSQTEPKVSFALRRSDITKNPPVTAVDELFANLPFGNRVGDHQTNQRLYRALCESLCDRLKIGATAVLYTMEGKLLWEELSRLPNLQIVKKARIEAGGLEPKIYIVQRR